MAWVERRVTRTSQPQDGCGLDKSHPLFSNVLVAYNGSNPVEIVSGQNLTLQAGSVRLPNPMGVGLNGSTTVSGAYCTQAKLPNTEASIFWAGDAAETSTSQASLFGITHNSTNANPYVCIELKRVSTSGFTLTFGYNGISYGYTNFATAIFGPITLSGSVASGAQNLYLGGALVAQTSTGYTNLASSPTARFEVNDSLNSRKSGSTCAVGYVFDIALSAQWHKSLSDNPWQIFEPQVEYVWVDDVIPLAPPNSKGRWIENKVQRTSQPQELVGIDWNNPLTVGLVTSYVPGVAGVDLVSGAVFAYEGGASTNAVTEEGLAFKSSPTRAKTNSLPRFQNDLSFLWLGSVNVFSGLTGQVFNQRASYTDGGLTLSLGFVGTSLLQFNAKGAANGALSVNQSEIGYGINQTRPVAGTVAGTAQKLFIDGIEIGSRTNSVTLVNQTVPVYIGALSNGAEQLNANHLCLHIWNRALSAEEVKSLSDNPWQIFEPTTEYIWVNDFTTSGTTPVDSDRLINYLINTSSTTDLPLNYSIRTSAIQDAIFEYSINSSLSSDRSATYNIRASASSDDLNQYLIRTFANSDITSSFNTRTSAANDEAVNYLIRANAAADANYSFNTRTNAFSDAGYSYLIRNATQVDFSTLYNIFGPLASDLIQSYNIRSSVNTSSTYNFNTQNSIQSDEVNQYNIRTTASNTTAADYNIRTNAGTNLESLYEIINAGQVSQALNIQYNIRALSDNSFNSYYLIYSAVGQNVDAAYIIRTNTFKDIQFSYDIAAGISTIASDLTAMYNVLSTSSITQQDLINISTQVWNHSLTGDRTPGSAGSMLQDVSAREAAR